MRTVRMWRGGGEGGIGAKISHSPCHKLHMVLNCSGVRNIPVLSLLHCKSPLPWYHFFSNTKIEDIFSNFNLQSFRHFGHGHHPCQVH